VIVASTGSNGTDDGILVREDGLVDHACRREGGREGCEFGALIQ